MVWVLSPPLFLPPPYHIIRRLKEAGLKPFLTAYLIEVEKEPRWRNRHTHDT